MASIYRRKDSDKVWIRYKAEDGAWKARRTGYRWTNPGERRQAELLARKQSEIEAGRKRGVGDRLDEWVLPWILSKYSGRATTTPDRYKRVWRTLCKFLDAEGIRAAGQVTREHASRYLAWRAGAAGRNSAIQELKFLAMVISEAENRGYVLGNPFRRLGIRKEKTEGKTIWSDEDICRAQAHFERGGSHWMLCCFYLGLYQACRLRQCAIPLDAIRLDLGVIQYPDAIVKGLEGFAQPIDARLGTILDRLMVAAREGGLDVLCVIPWDASIRLRRSLDRAGLPKHSHHGLRATWITRAAERGVPESQAMAFCHHSSREVHRVYKRLSAVGIAHVPELMRLPDFSGSACGEGGGFGGTTRGSGLRS